MQVECVDCEVTITDIAAPPIIAASHDSTSLPEVYSKHLLCEIERINCGFCTHCSGRINTRVEEMDDPEIGGLEGFLNVVYECCECGGDIHTAVGAAVIDHPAVVSLFHDAGIDVRRTPVWELDPLSARTGKSLQQSL